jgi:signal transduction histidine kinase
MSNSAQIRFSPEILRRLGEELNPSPDKGILELVKNAYDANAKECTVTLVNTERPGGSIMIKDDGDGMGEEEIRNGWLVLGRSGKSLKAQTRLGRTPAGSKGLGRLAALRLGRRARLSTRPLAEPNIQYDLLIEWKAFEDVAVVEDVDLMIESSKRAKALQPGTEVSLEKLSAHVTRADVKRLARELILLADPFGDAPEGFKPALVAPEFADLEVLVKNRYFTDAEYHLRASVDADGFASAAVLDWKGQRLFEAKHGDLTVARSNQPYRCPKLEFNLWVFILDADTFSTRKSSVGEVRNWLNVFGGVHVYSNGLRVTPYGDPGNDWLDMNLSRARSPEERPSTNTVIGRLMLSDELDLMVQKTDRSGFIETESFQEVRSFAQGALEWMAHRRLERAQKRRAQARQSALEEQKPSKRSLDQAIEAAPPSVRVEIKKAADAHERAVQQDIRRLQKEVQLYRTLSTAGITAATFAHESSGNPIKVITQSIRAVERRAKEALGPKYTQLLEKPVTSIIRAMSSLAVLGSATLKLIDHEKRRSSSVDLHQVIKRVIETFEPFTDGRDVKVTLCLCPGAPYLQGSEAAVESIVTNLLNNSLAAFEEANVRQRAVELHTLVQDGKFQLRVLDNGPGIVGVSPEDIWIAGVTTRKNGTGLGLTIVKDTVLDLSGDAHAVAHGALGGAEILVELPIIGT